MQTGTQADFESLQSMLAAAHTLASERRLSRFALFRDKGRRDALLILRRWLEARDAVKTARTSATPLVRKQPAARASLRVFFP